MSDEFSVMTEERRATAIHINLAMLDRQSGKVAKEMRRVWRTPVRHNRRLEQLALRDTMGMDVACRIVLKHQRSPFVTPPLPDAAKRYDIEAAIRTIPDLIPFTEQECGVIRRTRLEGFDDYGPRDDAEITPSELVDRWHEWLWTPKNPGERAAVPNPEAEALAAGYQRLSEAMLGAVAIWRASTS